MKTSTAYQGRPYEGKAGKTHRLVPGRTDETVCGILVPPNGMSTGGYWVLDEGPPVDCKRCLAREV